MKKILPARKENRNYALDRNRKRRWERQIRKETLDSMENLMSFPFLHGELWFCVSKYCMSIPLSQSEHFRNALADGVQEQSGCSNMGLSSYSHSWSYHPLTSEKYHTYSAWYKMKQVEALLTIWYKNSWNSWIKDERTIDGITISLPFNLFYFRIQSRE